MFNFFYYSFVTLTTLGYGDVTPVSGIARALSYLEATTGVMYTAVLIAALVGAYASNAPNKH
ncbi:potassium channel family protein [Kaarinaea lacus]